MIYYNRLQQTMKEIETSGERKVTVQLDDEDYEKIMKLKVPRIYLSVNHTKFKSSHGPLSLYVYPKGYNTNRKTLTTFLFEKGKGYKVRYADGNFLNLQRNNVTSQSSRKK